MEPSLFYEKIQADDPEIDMFAGGWGIGYDPNPANLFGETAKFNFSRFVSPEGNEIIGKIGSIEAFDEAKNVEFFKQWQKYVHDQAFIFPTLIGESVTAVNKRVKFMNSEIGTKDSKSELYQIELVSETATK